MLCWIASFLLMIAGFGGLICACVAGDWATQKITIPGWLENILVGLMLLAILGMSVFWIGLTIFCIHDWLCR